MGGAGSARDTAQYQSTRPPDNKTRYPLDDDDGHASRQTATVGREDGWQRRNESGRLPSGAHVTN